MRRFQNILYVTRGTADETDALKHALSQARANSASLCAFVVGPPLPKKLAELEASYEASLAERMNASIASAQSALAMQPDEVKVAVEVDCGDTPAVRIVRRVLRGAHDLLIKVAEVDERDSSVRALDMQLLRTCPCPVWLSRPISRARADVRVAVAVDPMSAEPASQDLAIQLLQLSRVLADSYSGELSIVSAWDFEFEDYLRHSPWARMSDEAISDNVLTAERDHQTALDELIARAGLDGRLSLHRPRGRPDQAIPQAVDELGIDILVMGTLARTGIPGFVIGNTAENTARQVRCSLIAVKPNGFVSPIKAY